MDKYLSLVDKDKWKSRYTVDFSNCPKIQWRHNGDNRDVIDKEEQNLKDGKVIYVEPFNDWGGDASTGGIKFEFRNENKRVVGGWIPLSYILGINLDMIDGTCMSYVDGGGLDTIRNLEGY